MSMHVHFTEIYVYTHMYNHAFHTHCSHVGYIPSNYVKRVRHEFEGVAMYTFSPKTEDDLPLTKGEKITVLDTSEGDRWFARNQLGYVN